MVTFSPATVLLADSHLTAPEEGEFPLFVVLALLAVIAVMALAAARRSTDGGTPGRYRSNRHQTAQRPHREPLGHPLDRIDT
ncbi:hypothetical protein ACFTWF_22465 [Rhodococcus sp. NPDC056960]|uniref:hypothetical protein n=1 Tax=Rhodococcus sp. NPDC056960 TaxID=3345982 RepID=UPI003629E65E